MINRKGQALVEFVLLIPVIIILIFGMIEIGNLIREKYLLENNLDTAIQLYKNNKNELIDNYEIDNKVTIDFSTSGNLITATISKKIDLITPGIKIITNPYTIKTQRTFYKTEPKEVTNSE